MRAYNARPEVKERRRKHKATPEAKARRSAYMARPETRKLTRASNLKHQYGLTTPEVDAMVSAQGGRCFLCRKIPSGKGPNACLNVDHCHETGKVRAMLCSRCNSGLGYANDDPALLRKMADYLEAHQ